MTNSTDWLYFHYILPMLQEEDQGEYAESIENLRKILDIRQSTDFEMAVEFYAIRAFRLGLRTGAVLRRLLADE